MNNDYSRYRHYARKRFGQNFLKDECIIDSIVSAISPQKGEILVEIGPGLGALTEPIIRHSDTLTVIELDRNLASYLQNHPSFGSKLNIYQQDVMRFDFSTLSKKKSNFTYIW